MKQNYEKFQENTLLNENKLDYRVIIEILSVEEFIKMIMDKRLYYFNEKIEVEKI